MRTVPVNFAMASSLLDPLSRASRSAWSTLRAAVLVVPFTACGRSSAPRESLELPPVSELSPDAIAWSSWGRTPTDWSALPSQEALGATLVPVVVESLDDERTADVAAWLLGRLGGRPAVDTLVARFEREPALDSAAIAALAFLAPPPSLDFADPNNPVEDALWAAYATAEEPDRREALLLAIARLGFAGSQYRLAAELSVRPNDDQEASAHQSALVALGMLCARGLSLTLEGVDAVARSLEDEGVVRAGAAYAIGRCATPSAEWLVGREREELVSRLVAVTTSGGDDEDLAWRALAELGGAPPIDSILRLVDPLPWRVEVEAVRALAQTRSGRAWLAARLATLGWAYDGARIHVVLAVLDRLQTTIAHEPELLGSLDALNAAATAGLAVAPPSSKKRFALVRCAILALQSIVSREDVATEGCAAGVDGLPEDYGAVLAVHAKAHSLDPVQVIPDLLTKVADPRSRVAQAAISVLAPLDDPGVNERLRTALEQTDLGIRTAAATAVAVRAIETSRRDLAAVPLLVEVVNQLDNAHAVEARLRAIDALGALARSATDKERAQAQTWLRDTVLPLASDPEASIRAAAREALAQPSDLVDAFDEAIERIVRRERPTDTELRAAIESFARTPARGLRMRTTAGSFDIAFADAPAPIAQAVLTALARQGFFDGLSFHRVVPGFVVQGGDPRGDGYGGPGFLLPSEPSNLRFERGTVGIATAGKDTGGSQFFITYGRQPHLDARYAVVGRVQESEMAVVDAILPFDRIEQVEVLDREGTP